MVSGYLLMFLYTILMLGNVNRIEHRTYLTAAGIAAVALGLVVSIGLGALLNLPYTPMHAILPFLCLGKCLNHKSVGRKSSTYPKIHILKVSFLTKFAFSKIYF